MAQDSSFWKGRISTERAAAQCVGAFWTCRPHIHLTIRSVKKTSRSRPSTVAQALEALLALRHFRLHSPPPLAEESFMSCARGTESARTVVGSWFEKARRSHRNGRRLPHRALREDFCRRTQARRFWNSLHLRVRCFDASLADCRGS